jgi:hypothetical protein
VTTGVDANGRLVVSTYPERVKALNARRHPAGSALVLSDEWEGQWVQVWGSFEVLDLPDALDPLVEYYRSIAGSCDPSTFLPAILRVVAVGSSDTSARTPA